MSNRVIDRRRRKNQHKPIIEDVIINKPGYYLEIEENPKFVEIILEKYYNNTIDDINDFDAVFAYMLKSENIDRLKYGKHGYLINTIKPYPIPKCNGAFFQLMETTKNIGTNGVRGLTYAQIRICSIKLPMRVLKLFINACKKEYIADKNNKLGGEIYYFDHETHVGSPSSNNGIMDKYITFSKMHFHTNKTFDNVFFTDKEVLKNRVHHFLNNRDWYNKRGIPYTLGFMFHGGPGTGKTSTIKAIANASQRHVFNVKLGDVKTNTQLRNLFQSEYVQVLDPVSGKKEKYIIPIMKRLYVIEDIDSMADIVRKRSDKKQNSGVSTRGGNVASSKLLNSLKRQLFEAQNDYNNPERKIKLEADIKEVEEELERQATDAITLSSLLDVLDGTYEIPDRMFCITTNDPDTLDPAFIRPGRVDMIVKFSNATHEIMVGMFSNFYEQKFTIDMFEGICEKMISPATVNQIMFKHFYHPGNAIKELESLATSIQENGGPNTDYIRQ
jgi:DNA polymerase III delta prime subunit